MDNQDLKRHQFFEERGEGWENRNYRDEHRQKLIKMVNAFNLSLGSRVLDIGCGEGVLTPYLREALGEAGQIISLDPSESMLKGAAQKENGKAIVLLASAEQIPLPAFYVDTVICFAAFPHFSDKVQAAKEAFRVLKASGKIYVAHLMSREELRQHHNKHDAVCGDHLPCPIGMQKIFTEAGFIKTSLEEESGWYLFTAEKSNRE